MRAGMRKLRINPCGGTSLIELMTAMAILSVILVMLSVALEASLGEFRSSTDRTANRTSGGAALEWLKRDLATALPPEPRRLAPLPDSVTAAQRRFFENRNFLPFEINRNTSRDDAVSLPNAAPEFDWICFVTRLPQETLIEAHDEFDQAKPLSLPSIVGYYVAYTRNSPLTGDDTASMKLFRHWRPGGTFSGERYASGFLRRCHAEINDVPALSRSLHERNPAAVRQGGFSNADLPALLAMRQPDSRFAPPVKAKPAWPVLALPAYLPAPPPTTTPDRGTMEAWRTPESTVHDTIFPDEPLCANIVRFEIEASRRVELSPSNTASLGASELNSHLGLNNGEEWPCLILPDSITVRIGVVNESTARTLTRYEDWIIDWELTDPSQWTPARKRIEQGLQIFEQRISMRKTQS